MARYHIETKTGVVFDVITFDTDTIEKVLWYLNVPTCMIDTISRLEE